MKIDEFIKEIEELKRKAEELEYLKIDKTKMADKLYEYELKEYEKATVDERKEKFFNEYCLHCRHECDNKDKLPDDIDKPIRTDKDYFPAHKICKDFEWD